jgi:hypothetical protein
MIGAEAGHYAISAESTASALITKCPGRLVRIAGPRVCTQDARLAGIFRDLGLSA